MTLKNKEWLDANWPKHFVELNRSPRLPLYYLIWGMLRSRHTYPKVTDLGCGDGNFGQLVTESDGAWIGVDISYPAVVEANKKVPGNAFVGDLMDVGTYFKLRNIDTDRIQVLIEVLEHVEDDLFVLNQLQGREVILSVPNFDSEDHARYFKDVLEVHERYDHLFAECWGNATITYPTNNKVYILYGRLR